LSFLYILPALGFAIIMIYFLGFYDFDMNYVGDEMYALQDMNVSDLDNLKLETP